MNFELVENNLEKLAGWESSKDYSGNTPEPFCWHEVCRKDGAEC